VARILLSTLVSPVNRVVSQRTHIERRVTVKESRALRKQEFGDGSPFLSSDKGHIQSKSHESQTDFGRGWICSGFAMISRHEGPDLGRSEL